MRDAPPDFGLYLDDRWQPPWSHDHVAWPDFGTPDDAVGLEAALTSLLHRAREGQHVEIGCLGGHGRTGTALACLAVIAGTPPDEAVAWVRSIYCDRAIESTNQEKFIANFTAS
jgi:protein-tyrosine phosphatase